MATQSPRMPDDYTPGSAPNGAVLLLDSLAERWVPTVPPFAAASHTHEISGVVGLQTSLDGKAASTHQHPVTDLTATGTPDGTKFLRDDGAWATPEGGGGNTHTSADATRPALPAGTVWLSTAATRPATMQTGDIWIGEPL